MNYPKIVSVEVINFMVYKHAKIIFDDNNIINIKGYNSGGKSSLLKAIAVCLMNKYPKAQSKFIRHGEKYFRVIVKFEDNVVILKDRYVSGQSLYEMYKDGECLYSTKEGNRLTRVDGIPQVIQDYLGLCIVSTGCLNYQVRQDPLWLIETAGSENYNSLNEILKTEEISRANAMLNSDKNKLNSEIAGIEASLQEVKLSLIEEQGYTDELLNELEYRESICKELSVQYKCLKDIVGIITELKGIRDIPKLSKIDSDRLEKISCIDSEAFDIGNIPDYPLIEKCDIDRFVSINEISKDVSEIQKDNKHIPKVETIEVNRVECFKNMLSILSDLNDNLSEIKKLDTIQKSTLSELNTLVEEARKKGIDFVQCTNCGTYIEVKR